VQEPSQIRLAGTGELVLWQSLKAGRIRLETDTIPVWNEVEGRFVLANYWGITWPCFLMIPMTNNREAVLYQLLCSGLNHRLKSLAHPVLGTPGGHLFENYQDFLAAFGIQAIFNSTALKRKPCTIPCFSRSLLAVEVTSGGLIPMSERSGCLA